MIHSVEKSFCSRAISSLLQALGFLQHYQKSKNVRTVQVFKGSCSFFFSLQVSQHVESDEDAIAENIDVADISDAPFGAKRQRRPSVRLEDLGDQHAAPSADKRKKKLGVRAVPLSGKSPALSKESLPLSSSVSNRLRTDKALNTRPGVVNNGGLHRYGSFDDGDYAQRAELSLSCCMDGSAEPHPVFENQTSRNMRQQLLRITGKKVRNGSRKSVVSKLAESVKKSPSLHQSGSSTRGRRKGKVSGSQIVKDMHFDKENNAYDPAAFEASAYMGMLERNGHKEQGETVLLHTHQQHQSGDYWPQIRGGRTHQSASRRQPNGSVYVPKGKLIVKANRSLHVTGDNLVVEASGNGVPSIRHIVRQSPRPRLGVREWLQDLGLGKYAELFEAHEVEPEILPLLTLDDLREMGVAAVGSRRKMFYAIQHFKKAMLAEAD